MIALKNDLVPESIRPKMVEHLCNMIQENQGCLDTGFLSILFLMDVLCENGRRDVAYQLMFQTKCPSWLYEVEKGATTMWESWGAVAEDGTVSTYSYNHYAFGCVGEWMYRELGGLQAAAPGYKKIRIAPAVDCGLDWARVKEKKPRHLRKKMPGLLILYLFFRETVKMGIFFIEVIQKGFGRNFLAAETLDNFPGGVEASILMNIGIQPFRDLQDSSVG